VSGRKIGERGVVKRERRHDKGRMTAFLRDGKVSQSQCGEVDNHAVRRGPFWFVARYRLIDFGKRLHGAPMHVHRGRPRPYPYAPGVHAAVRHGGRIAVSMRDGSRSLRQIAGIAQHGTNYGAKRPHKEMRYMGRHITAPSRSKPSRNITPTCGIEAGDNASS